MTLWLDGLSGRGGEGGSGDDGLPEWPEVTVSVRRGVVPVWTLESGHPALGPLRGRGITRGMAERSIARRARLQPPVDGGLTDITAGPE